MIAALFIQRGGVYSNLHGVDAWDESRDARKYAGPYPVIAHPPCSRWCQLAHINQKRYGHVVGSDGGCFAHALDCVRRFGGVLEHPAFSYAWHAFHLQRPRRGSWQYTAEGAWVTEVSQGRYGHRARKRTWLYYVGAFPPALDWTEVTPSAQISWCKNHGNSPLPRLSKKEAAATPVPFRNLLIGLASNTALKVAA
jgi:hypothetical protein